MLVWKKKLNPCCETNSTLLVLLKMTNYTTRVLLKMQHQENATHWVVFFLTSPSSFFDFQNVTCRNWNFLDSYTTNRFFFSTQLAYIYIIASLLTSLTGLLHETIVLDSWQSRFHKEYTTLHVGHAFVLAPNTINWSRQHILRTPWQIRDYKIPAQPSNPIRT